MEKSVAAQASSSASDSGSDDHSRIAQTHADGGFPRCYLYAIALQANATAGTVDYVAKEIIGGDSSDLPRG